MKARPNNRLLSLALALALGNTSLIAVRAASTEPDDSPLVEIAILLDTSGSMSGRSRR